MLSPEELQRRLTGIGSSDIPEVIGVGYRDRGAIGVYLEKRQLIESIPDNEMMEWGRRLEEPIAVKAGEELGLKLVELDKRDLPLRHHQREWMLATPDRVELDQETGHPVEGVECKNPHQFSGKNWGPSGSKRLPLRVIAQVTWQMEVVGLDRWHVACLIGGNDFRLYTVHYHEGLARKLIAAGEKFWFEHVQKGVPPEPDASPGWAAYFKSQFPEHTVEVLEANEKDERLAHQLYIARTREKKWKTVKTECENRLKFRMSDAGVLHGEFGRITWQKNGKARGRAFRPTFRQDQQES